MAQKAMNKQQMARPTAEKMTMALLPPRARSTNGPNRGPTTANGATVRASDKATRDCAARTETSKKIEPARATATIASPAEERPWTTARRRNGVLPRALSPLGTASGAPDGRRETGPGTGALARST